MRSALLLLQVVALLVWWDVNLKSRLLINWEMGQRYLDRMVPVYAHRLLSQARAATGITMQADVRGALGTDVPFAVLANHQSVLDIVAIMAAFDQHSIRFIAKSELRHGYPAVSQILRSQRHALINRQGDFGEAMRRIELLASRCIGPVCPVIFPEGTRSKDGKVGRFHSGAVRRLLQGQSMPIVAVAVDGGWQFSRLSDVTRLPDNHVYRLAVVGVYPAPKSKNETLKTIETARDAIVLQVDTWQRVLHA